MAETANMQSPEMRYLLGTLSEEEGTRLEEAFFADDSKFEAIELAEDELIDAYVRSELPAEALQKFKTKLRASPRLTERVYFAQALAEALAEKTLKLVAKEAEAAVPPAVPVTPKVAWWKRLLNVLSSGPRLAFAACVLLLLVGGVALITNLVRLRNESERIGAERAAIQRQKEELEKQLSEQQTKTTQLTADVQRQKEQQAEYLKLIEELRRLDKPKEAQTGQLFASTFATVELGSGSVRSIEGGQAELIIKPSTTTARLQIALDKNDYRAYNAEITTADETVIRKNRLKPRNSRSGPQLLLFVPARLLTRDSYILHLDGVTTTGKVEDFNDYPFRVTKK